MGPDIYSILLTITGLFPIVVSLANWNFFFEHPIAKTFVNIFGRQGARIFYGFLGIGISLIGSLSIAGIITLEN